MPAHPGNNYAVEGGADLGRPSKYQEDYPERVYRLALLGLTEVEMASFFDVSIRTFDSWKVSHEDFLRALKEGKEEADSKVAHALYSRALGYSHPAVKMFYDKDKGEVVKEEYIEHYPPDSNSAQFWLRNRKSNLWRDKREIEISDPKEKLAELLGLSKDDIPTPAESEE